ncbi:MAG: class I SAM-dependent methyltransferase [Sphingomonadales bacterium]|nr:MAG: class I SAM-dependent methyltransferase [Sphingomonadales bacterium]
MTDTLEWTGRVGDVWAEEWRRTDRSFANLSRHLDAAILAAAPEQGIAIDIGSGAGGTSIALATARPHVSVTGIDLSPALVATAQDRAAGLANLEFRVGDAQALGALDADLLFSRHGVMFFADPVVAFASLRGAAKPGAKLVFSCFRPRAFNPWTLVTEAAVGASSPPSAAYAPGPYGLADLDFTREMLGKAGWVDATAEIVDFAYVAGAGEDPVEDALSYFQRIGPAARAIALAAPEHREALRGSLRAVLAEHLHDGVVTFGASAWIWKATAGEAEV